MATVAPVLTPTHELDRPSWLAARRAGIGGSDAAALLGLDPWKSPLAVYLDKRGELPDDEAGEAAEWGNRLEPVVAKAAEDRINDARIAEGLDPVMVRKRHAILQHPDLPWMLANIDREVLKHEHGPGLLEVKTTGYWASKDWDDGPDPDLPEKYHVQLQHYMAVTGRNHGWLAVLVAGQKLVIEYVQRDQDLIDALIEVETAFWRRVEDGNPPPASARDDELTKQLHDQVTPGKAVTLPAEAADLVEQRAAAKAAESAAADRRKEAEARLRQLIGDADEAYLPGSDRPCFTYREVRPKKFDTKAFEQAHPDLHAEFVRESAHRRFDFKKGA